MSPVTEALAAVVHEDAAFAALLEQLYAAHYTGTVLLHFADGLPRTAEFPARRTRLLRIRLDNAPRIADTQ